MKRLCQEIKARLGDARSEFKNHLISVARVDRERCSATPLPARADQGRPRLVFAPLLVDLLT